MSGSNMLVLLVVSMLLIGPERLPDYARQLAELVRALRRLAADGSRHLREELGPDFDGVDLASLDPRQYDPRRIVRDALRADAEVPQEESAEPRAADDAQPSAGT